MLNLSQVIKQSENSEAEQNSEVLGTVANYITELATFVNNSMVIIDKTVSNKKFSTLPTIPLEMSSGC